MRNRLLLRALAAVTMTVSGAMSFAADTVRTERLAISVDRTGKLISQTVRSDEKFRYEVSVAEGQTLSVDLFSEESGIEFAILPVGSDFPVHASALDGHVADIVVPQSGDYLVDVFLEADDPESGTAGRALLTIDINGPDVAAQLLGGPDFWAVTGLKDGAMLNLRAGPSTRYQAEGQLQNGEPVQNNGCRLTLGERWCFIRVPSMQTAGWVAGRFLVEGSAPE